jgi:hypothetical protein
MNDDPSEETTENVSDALLDASDEAYKRWMEAVGGGVHWDEIAAGETGGGIAWDILTDDAYTSRFTSDDWATLRRLGQWRVRTGPRMTNEMAATLDNDPDFVSALIGLMVLMGDRFEHEHPERAEGTGADSPPRRGLFAGWTTRLWRRKQVAPGVRINLSKSGPSITFGPKGAHVTYGPRGTTETIGLPGTGAYLQRRKPKSPQRPD